MFKSNGTYKGSPHKVPSKALFGIVLIINNVETSSISCQSICRISVTHLMVIKSIVVGDELCMHFCVEGAYGHSDTQKTESLDLWRL